MTQNDSMVDLKQQALVDINEAQNERVSGLMKT